MNTWTWLGVVVGVFGCGPLLAIIALASIGLWPDPNPNPIGPGLLFFVSSPVVVVLLAIGAIVGWRQPATGSAVQLPATMRSKVERAKLTDEQRLYISSSSLGGAAGLLYFVYMGVPGAYFRHLVRNLYWPHTVANARRYAWGAGGWRSFDDFRRRADSADTVVRIVLSIGLPILLLLLFIG